MYQYIKEIHDRDMTYHQGITWTWLLGLYYNSLENMLKYAKTKKEKQN